VERFSVYRIKEDQQSQGDGGADFPEITRYPLNNPAFLRLASTIKSVVEENSNDEAVFRSRIRIAALLEKMAGELHEIFPNVPKKRLMSINIKIFAITIGLFQITTTSEEIQQRLKRTT